MGYKYEMHMHTCQGSACGRATGAEQARYYKDIGFTGIFVTDHFYRGNTFPDRSLPWRDWVHAYCKGYEDAWNEGQRIGLDVFFAWEETYHGDDYLIYGLSPDWLLEHPEVKTWTHKEQYEAVRSEGGCVIQAHPFRMRDYIERIHLCPLFVDGVEVANAGHDAFSDAYAYRYAQKHGFFMTAGSDNHRSEPGMLEAGKIYGIETETRLRSPADYVRIVLNHEPIRLLCPEQRFAMDEHTPSVEPWNIEPDDSITRACADSNGAY